MKSPMSLTFFGVRGSYPVPGRRTLRYGGNTSALLLEIADQALIFDAGTGIIRAGRYLSRRYRDGGTIHLFLSHLHADHIQGLPFFAPLFNPRLEIVIHSPEAGGGFQDAVEALFVPPYSPITLAGIKARIRFQPLDLSANNHSLRIDPAIDVSYIQHDSHPRLGVIVYQVAHQGRRLVYATDVESPDGFDGPLGRFVDGADVLIHDSQYLDGDYGDRASSKKGFGHSTVSMAVRNARACRVKKLFLFHFNPDHSDRQLETMLRQARRGFKNTFLSQEEKKISIR
jgi:ribonuclease BN (tRNA processing enzyme)